jgi:hypothetical protein
MTVYSGARNDLMPPWLWPNPLLPDNPNINNNAQPIDPDDMRQIVALNLKCDLRRPETPTSTATVSPVSIPPLFSRVHTTTTSTTTATPPAEESMSGTTTP